MGALNRCCLVKHLVQLLCSRVDPFADVIDLYSVTRVSLEDHRSISRAVKPAPPTIYPTDTSCLSRGALT